MSSAGRRLNVGSCKIGRLVLPLRSGKSWAVVRVTCIIKSVSVFRKETMINRKKYEKGTGAIVQHT
jgi:hypothetical protein